MANTLLCISRIKGIYETLSRSEKVIADYIIENFRDKSSFKSANELAKKTKTSAATIVRFCKSLGFAGFSDFKMTLFREILGPMSSVPDLEPDDSVPVVKQKVLMFNKHIIDGMTTVLDDESIDAVATLLKKAGRIMIVGDGGSGSSARNAYDVFLQLGLNCEYVTDPFYQVMAIGQLTENDVVFALSNSGRSRNTIENVKHAKERGVPTIGIVGMPNTPISKYLDQELYANVFTNDYFCDSVAAQICEICIISVLHSVLVLRGSDEVLMDKKLTDTLNRKRVEWDEKI